MHILKYHNFEEINESIILITGLGILILPLLLAMTAEYSLKKVKLLNIKKLILKNSYNKKEIAGIISQVSILNRELFKIRLDADKQLQKLKNSNKIKNHVEANIKLKKIHKELLDLDSIYYANMYVFVEGYHEYLKREKILNNKYKIKDYTRDIIGKIGQENYSKYQKDFDKMKKQIDKFKSKVFNYYQKEYFKKYGKTPIEEIISINFLIKIQNEIIKKIKQYNLPINMEKFEFTF